MSGSSTLRICLAAMAPALTEVTARLKLQDNSESVVNKLGENSSGDSKVRPCDINALGGVKRPGEERPVHLSHSVKLNGTHFDPNRSSSVVASAATVCDNNNTRNSHFSCVLANASSTLTSIKALSTIGPHLVSGDFQRGLSSKANQFIDNLLIMNQPQIDADKLAQHDEVDSKIVSEGSLNCGNNIKAAIKPPVMVNGNSDSRKNIVEEDIRCSERRDFQTRKENSSLDNQQFPLSVSSSQTKNISGLKMGICVQTNQSCSTSQVDGATRSDVQIDEKSKDDLRKECGRKQAYLERKVDILLRRLKRMKGKVVEIHAKEQLKQFVNYQHKNLQKVAKTIKNESPAPENLNEHFLSNEEVKNMSTAQLVKLVKTYQPNQSTTTNDVSAKLRLASSSAVVMDPVLRDESLKISERLAQRVMTASAELDSDATASSSGGESGDEDATSSLSSNNVAVLPPLLKRAEWKWAVDRAAVVSRWTWLKAQVSDLEYRIRQQSLVHRQLRNSKGGVVLGDPPTAVEILRKLQGISSRQAGNAVADQKNVQDSSVGNNVSPCNISAVMSNVDKQASRLAQSLGNYFSPVSSTFGSPAGSSKISSPFVNGLTDSPCSSTTSTCETMSDSSPVIPAELRLTDKTSDLLEHAILADVTCQAARCRPLRSYRKRKILRTIGLYKTNLKAARLSDVKCRCYPPDSPCPICGGRYNNTLTIDPDAMSLKERIAILDPSFHPVLSFPQDIQLSIHCEGLVKSGLWQTKPQPRRSRVGDYRKQKVISLVTESVRKNGNNRQNGRNNNTSVINFSTKIKNKYETKKTKASGSKGAPVKPCVNKVKKKAAAKMAREVIRRSQADEEEDELETYLEQELSTSGGRDNGLTGSASQSSLNVHQRKRKVDNSFDINNIVIPLSMATSTRIEQPQYKEIVTPKWRELSELKSSLDIVECSIAQHSDISNEVSLVPISQQQNLSDEDEVEDLADEKFAARHLLLEQEEKKRFRNFVQYPPVRRSRARSDAVNMTSSGMVPEKTDIGESGLEVAEDSLLPSRPSTPVLNKSLHSAHGQSSNVEDSIDSLQQQLSVRRRTMSFTKRDRTGSLVSDDIHNPLIDVGGVEPWPRRTFPLSDEEYRLMQEDLPPSCEPVHQRVARRLADPSGKVYVGGSVDNTDDVGAVPSPHPSTESMSSAGDDPNDPEWVGGDSCKRRSRRIINDESNDTDWVGGDTFKRRTRRITGDDAGDPDWVVSDSNRRFTNKR